MGMDTDNSPQDTTRFPIRSHWLFLIVLFAMGIVFYRDFLSQDMGPLHRDFGTIFLSKMQQQYDALRTGALLLWDPILYGGTAFWPLPNTAPAYVPLLACFWLRDSVLGGLNLALLLHLLFGASGVYLLVFRMSGRRLAALAAGLLFLYARYAQQIAYILPLDMIALSWLPWTLYFLIRGLEGGSWVRCALAAGVTFSAVTWCGGYNIFLYGLIICGLVIALGSFRAPRPRNLIRGPMLIVLFFVTFLVLSAGRLLPTAYWLPLTSRAEGIHIDFASIGQFSGAEIVVWLQQEGWIVMGLLVVGLLVAIRQRRMTWSVPFTAAVGMIVLFSSGIVFPFLHEYVPGFDRIREPRRVCILMPAVLPVVAGLGFACCQAWFSLRGVKAFLAGVLALGAMFADTALDFQFRSTDSRPAGVRLSYERPNLYSFQRRLKANAIHMDLAQRARKERRFRIHDYGDTRDNLKRTADLIRSAFRLETLEAVLGNISIRDYDFDYFGTSEVSPALLWGLMNCKYVTSGVELDVPGLEFEGKFKEDPYELKPDSDGPFLYRNTKVMPRAWLVDDAALFVDREPHDGYTWRSLVFGRAWNSRTTVLVRAGATKISDLSDDELRKIDMAFAYGESGVDPSAKERLDGLEIPLFDFKDEAIDPQKQNRFKETLKSMKTPFVPVDDPKKEWNRMRVELPEEAGFSWLVLAETFGLYPGWTATTSDGKSLPLFVSNGVTTAVPLPEGTREVLFEYTPPGWIVGMIVSLVGFLVCVVVILRRGIRDLFAPWPLDSNPS